ncbi:hypothetical protein QQY24_26355 [Streptomyces sp. TG1A-8]|uniref:hypothetical protein n=1 Tax=Streptomyces sp. TG1A-8 TaxID=3051385 RepID=UPI00265BF906|nr:hypothetical protein [Streptomyces sp. TG1A-8]MDO0928764.1 hypothetical protein [Streptomyces sp. TG1A-8]
MEPSRWSNWCPPHRGNPGAGRSSRTRRHRPSELKREIGKRLRKKVFFAADYPMLSHDELVQEWQEQGFAPDVLDDVFHGNAESFLTSIGVN